MKITKMEKLIQHVQITNSGDCIEDELKTLCVGIEEVHQDCLIFLQMLTYNISNLRYVMLT